MILSDLRSYDPTRTRLTLSHAFDFAADYAALEAATDLLSEARTNLDQARNARGVSASDDRVVYRLCRRETEARLVEVRVTLLEGLCAQAQTAVSSYPVRIAAKARANGFV